MKLRFIEYSHHYQWILIDMPKRERQMRIISNININTLITCKSADKGQKKPVLQISFKIILCNIKQNPPAVILILYLYY